jgi:SAM-dependent methyltransferase
MSDTTTNADQIEYWNEVSGPKWFAMQEELDEQLSPLQDALISYLKPEPGQHIIDIGCGCGATSLMLAGIVGSAGSVTGLDVSQPMLNRARERAVNIGLTNTTFEEGDAQTFPLDEATYDNVTSRFGIMFFANPTEAFVNFKSSLRADGSLTFMCWRTIQDNTWMTVPLMAAAEHLEMPPPPEPNSPGPFAFADKEYLKGLLVDAGFTSIEIVPFDSKMNMGAGSKIYNSVDFVTKIGPLSRLLQDLDDESVDKVKVSIRKALKPFQTSEGVELDAAVWLVKAK